MTISITIPAKSIIIIAAFVSTTVSLIAGLLLYQESITALYDTVDEISLSKASDTSQVIRSEFEYIKTHAQTQGKYILYTNVSSPMELTTTFGKRSWAHFMSSNAKGVYALACRLVKDINGTATGTQPWESPDTLIAMNNWVNFGVDSVEPRELVYYPNIFTALSLYNSTSETHAMRFSEVDPTTGDTTPTGSSVDIDVRVLVEEMAASRPDGRWGKVVVGGSRAKLKANVHLFWDLTFPEAPRSLPGWTLQLTAYMTFRLWPTILSNYKGVDDSMFVLDLSGDKLYAHTLFNDVPVKGNCTVIDSSDLAIHYGTRLCPLSPGDLGPTVQGAIQSAKDVGPGRFYTRSLDSTNFIFTVKYRENQTARSLGIDLGIEDVPQRIVLDGGEYFLRLSSIYSFDSNNTGIELLWMRPVSSVSDKVLSALIQFILFCVVIFVFDALIAVIEMLFLTMPLGTLSSAICSLQEMDLVEARRKAELTTSIISVSEVHVLKMGLLFACSNLEEYKAYLPDSVFEVWESTEDETKFSKMEESTEVSKANSKSSNKSRLSNERARLPTTRLVHIYNRACLCLVHVPLLAMPVIYGGEADFGMRFSRWLSIMEANVAATRGLFLGFGVASCNNFVVSWNITTRCDTPVQRAANCMFSVIEKNSEYDLDAPAIAAGIVMGKVTAGNLGSDTKRGFAVGGPAIDSLEGVCHVAKQLVVQLGISTVTVSNTAAESMLGEFLVCPYSVFDYGSLVPEIVFVVTERVTERGKEWMYMLEEVEDSVSMKVFDLFKKIRRKAATPALLEQVIGVLEKNKGKFPVFVPLIRKLQECAGDPLALMEMWAHAALIPSS